MARGPGARAVAVLGAALLLAPGAARATGDAATAEALFEAGRAARVRGDYETACAKLGESQRLDPAAGTLMNLAACEERRGRLASAWESFRGALGLLRADDERRAIVSERLASLEARLPRLELVLAPGAPAATRVSRDGSELGRAALGLPLPLDPGKHEVVAVADGFEPRTYVVDAVEGKTLVVAVEPGPVRAPAPPLVAPVQPFATPAPSSSPRPTSSGRTWGLALGGAGAVLLMTSGVTGVSALSRKAEIERHCTKSGGRYACDPERVEAARTGKALAVVSTLTLPAGLALLGLGTALYLTAGDDAPSVSAGVSPDGFAFGARGAF
jgi:hypothetical protein